LCNHCQQREIFLKEILERKPYKLRLNATATATGSGAGAGIRIGIGVSENILKKPEFFDDPKDMNHFYFYFYFGTNSGSSSG
jgi:hypothetical protein